jgi:hypothetical protein
MSDETFDVGRLVAGMGWLDDCCRERVSKFVLQACPGTQWGGAELATILVAGLGVLRTDPEDPFALALLHIAEELGRGMLGVMD